MKRSPLPGRTSRAPRENRRRRARELLRAYGTPERRAWMKTQPCIVCGRTPCDNAHVGKQGAGAGHRAGYDQIAPLCRRLHADGIHLAGCHVLSHKYGLSHLLGAGWEQKVAAAIKATQAAWLAVSPVPEDAARE